MDPFQKHARSIRASKGYFELGLYEDSLQELDALPSELHASEEVIELRTWNLMRLCNWDEALESAREVVDRYPHNPIGYIDLAYCLHEQSLTSEARETLLQAPRSIEQYPTYHYNLACYEATLGNLDTARRLLKTAVQMNPSYQQEAQKDPDLKNLWSTVA